MAGSRNSTNIRVLDSLRIPLLVSLRGQDYNRGVKVFFVAMLALLSASPAFSQQIASVDLTQSIESNHSTDKPSIPPPPEGCEKPEGMIADGVMLPEDKKPREILLELTKLSDRSPKVGSEVVAEIRLKNIDEKPINIPWSTDPNGRTKNQDPDHLEWEQGGFEILLESYGNDGSVLLKSAEFALFGSKFSPGSLLTIQPGEWVIAKMNFIIEARYFGTLGGESRLSVRWEQAARTWTRSKCGVNTGWFGYNDGFYKQERPAVIIQVISPDPTQKSAAKKQ